MLPLLPALLLAGSVNGAAALKHAASLASLGPHPWGSPRGPVAAQYVAAQFRDAGLQEVRLQDFADHGLHGTNVIGVLRGAGAEFVVVGAHHDSAPDAPGAYDDGGGVGVLIEAARVLAADKERARTLVFVSFDGEEAWSTGKTTTAGSRAYIKELGTEARNLVAAFVVEMCGWQGGTPVLHPIAYADPLRPGASVIAPRWLVELASSAASRAGAPLGTGDPVIPWLYQAGVRTFRTDMYGDDLSFLQAGLPAVFMSDSSFYAFYPSYHQASDTADKLDAGALARSGAAALAVIRALEPAPRGPASEPHWFSAFGRVLGPLFLLGLGFASVLPGLLNARGHARIARLTHALAFGFLLLRQPVPALWVLLLPNLLPLLPRRVWSLGLALLPGAALVGLGLVAWRRGFIRGLWLGPWELAALAAALLLALVPVAPASTGAPPKLRTKGGKGRAR
jgi:hypothetical protein